MTGPRHDDREMDALLRSWLADDAGPSPDRSGQVRQIMGRVDQVRQHRRLWRRIPFGRRAATGTAGGAEASVAPTYGRTAVLIPVRALATVALVVAVTMSLVWAVSRPVEQRVMPTGWAVDPADQALFERFVTLWAGEETDLATTQLVYADDAVHQVLWLDDEDVIAGSTAIWRRMGASTAVDFADRKPIRLPDHLSGAHRYLIVPSSTDANPLTGAACVLWIEGSQIARHDCIRPVSIESDEQPTLLAPDAATSAEREDLADALTVALAEHEPLGSLIAPDVAHHVLSTNQVYTLEGITEYRSVMSLGGTTTLMDVDLPAPDGEVRWANFSQIGTGTLCVFWARDGLITRHDCVMPSVTTVPASLTEIEAPPRS